MTANARPVPGYPDLFARADGTILRRGAEGLRPRKTRLHKGGRYVRIKRDGRTYEPSVACLVLAAFVGPCPDGHRAVHLDGNPMNNRLSNLAWMPRHGANPYVSGEQTGQQRPHR